jgi:TrmH family RNA methyltransferase
MAARPSVLRVTSRNAAFQQWQALLSNRVKRQRAGEFIIQGVRPITLAVEHRWPVRVMIYDISRPLSRWAREILTASGARRVAMAPELLGELGEKDSDVPEMVAVAAIPPDDFSRIPQSSDLLAVAFDRPASPGNIGTLIRSADAFGAHAVIVTGHAADPYDPKAVRASTGSLFAIPVVRAAGHAEVIRWARSRPAPIIGTDEKGAADIACVDLTGPSLLVIGNETTGLSAGWREACDVMARIPITGAVSSLNAAAAATITLYEAARQRRSSGGVPAAEADQRVAGLGHVGNTDHGGDHQQMVTGRDAAGDRTLKGGQAT